MVAFDADKAIDNSKLPELNILKKKTHNSQKKGILYFEKNGIVIEMTAVVKNKGGQEKGTIHALAVKTTDKDPVWDMGGLKYDFNKFFKQIANGNTDKLISNMFKKNDTIWGSHHNDKLYGFDGNDNIKGWKGDDYLNGGKGKDKLTGGKGKDIFAFDQKLTSKNVDKIMDYHVGQDVIHISKKIFSGFEKGKLGKEYFTKGNKADADHAQIIYNAKKGKLFYDSDGTGSADKKLFFNLQKHKDMTHDDFFVV